MKATEAREIADNMETLTKQAAVQQELSLLYTTIRIEAEKGEYKTLINWGILNNKNDPLFRVVIRALERDGYRVFVRWFGGTEIVWRKLYCPY